MLKFGFKVMWVLYYVSGDCLLGYVDLDLFWVCLVEIGILFVMYVGGVFL